MEHLTTKLSIDLDRRQPPGEVTVSAKQGDDQSREIIIALRSSGVAWEVPSSAALRIRLLKPDGKAVYNNLPQSADGKVHVTLEGQMLTAAGLARADIEITEGGTLLSSFLFFVDVTERAVPDGTIESTDEFGALQDALDRVDPAVEACETATDAANSAASSATSKITEMDQLKGDLETAEAARVKAEEGRVSAESTRVSQESARQSAEQQRQTDSAAAVSAANTAAERADTAADNANSKASLADTAAQNANTKAGLAGNAANAANTAATSATQAAQAAQTQAGAAESAASQAQTQAQAAQSAASVANTAAGSANTAADRANKAAEAIEGTDVGDLAVRVQDLEGEMDTVNGKIDGLNVPQMQQSITQLESEMDTAQQDISQLQTGLSSKVDKETGKGLSSNDYTDTDKAKVDSALQSTLSEIMLAIYPVGAIYMSTLNANPSTLFGGTWEAWGGGRVPVGVDTSNLKYLLPNMQGGEETHTLTIDEMPAHTHWIAQHDNSGSTMAWTPEVQSSFYAYGSETTSRGGSQAHNNMPPYITCYMWRRTK